LSVLVEYRLKPDFVFTILYTMPSFSCIPQIGGSVRISLKYGILLG